MHKTIHAIALCGVAAVTAASPAAEFAVDRRADRLVITTVAGEPVAEYVFADSFVGRPAIRGLAAPGGVRITRPCPPRAGVDADDHATMHPGAWLCFSDLSGADPWRHKTAVRFAGFAEEPSVVDGIVRFAAKTEYLATAGDVPGSHVVCRERSTVSIRDRTIGGEMVRILLWDAELSPGGDEPLVFGDVEEMGFGLRLATPLTPAHGGRYLASHGGRNEKGVFGRAAAWVDAAGMIDGHPVGATVIDWEDNPRDAWFHARDYGLVLANAFGRKAYGVERPPSPMSLQPGASVRLRYAVLLHGAVDDDRLGPLVREARAELAR